MRSVLLVGMLVVPSVVWGQFRVGGVAVDAKGVVRAATREDATFDVPIPTANDDVSRASKRRVVSLARLERAIADRRDAELTSVLAGLQRVEAVHLLADDVLLVGPAEGWATSATGDLVGRASKRPVLRLDDLLVALRYAFTEETVEPFLGCSIDPTPEGLQRAGRLRVRASRAGEAAGVLERAVGPQAVRVFGVPGGTPFALGLVAADVRLKRLAMGHDPTGVEGVPSFVELLAGSRRGGSSLVRNRFWFVARFDAIRESADGRSFELDGPAYGVRASAPRRIAGDDEDPNARPAPAAERFVTVFEEHAEELARVHPELAGLQNRIGLAVAAELIARPHLETADEPEARFWYPDRLIDAEFRAVPELHVPRFVPSLAGVRKLPGGRTLVHVSGGVEIDPVAVVRSASKPGRTLPRPVRPADESVWWWDAG